jgi:group I intron endonuclease
VIRKKRKDRRHMVYQLQNTISGDFYIGVTQGFSHKNLRVRILKHFQRALKENKQWKLCQNIRQFGVNSFSWSILEIIKGKIEAHHRERYLTKILKPSLNTQ